MYGIIIFLACYVTFTALWQGIMPVPQEVRRWITVGMGVLLLPLLALPIGTGGLRARPMDPKDPLAEPSMRLIMDEEEAEGSSGDGGLRSPLLSVKPPEFRWVALSGEGSQNSPCWPRDVFNPGADHHPQTTSCFSPFMSSHS